MVEQGTTAEAGFAGLRQGHVFDASPEHGRDRALVILSQTCDVVLAKRPTLILARVVSLHGTELGQANTGSVPRYIALPRLGDSEFADMSYVETQEKVSLEGCLYRNGIDLTDQQITRDFALAITRWFGRFPFPDEVVPWLRPVEGLIRQKYRKQSSLGEMLRDVIVEVRVETDWDSPPYDIQLHTIVRAEFLPTLDEDDFSGSEDFLARLQTAEQTATPTAAVANAFYGTSDPMERTLCLDAVARSFASACIPDPDRHQADESVLAAVRSVEGHLWADDDFPLSRVRKSEPLDLEYLSDSSDGR